MKVAVSQPRAKTYTAYGDGISKSREKVAKSHLQGRYYGRIPTTETEVGGGALDNDVSLT